MKMKSKYINFSIDAIIEANLGMQTIQRALDKLGFKNPSLNTFKSQNFMKLYESWDTTKQNSFLKLIGGTANYKKTKSFIESLNGE